MMGGGRIEDAYQRPYNWGKNSLPKRALIRSAQPTSRQTQESLAFPGHSLVTALVKVTCQRDGKG